MPSSIRPSRDLQVRLRAAPEDVTIDDWALRDRPLASAVAVMLAAGASWLAAQTTGSSAMGTIVAAALAVILWRTWLPVRYRLNGSGITQSVLRWRRRTPWSAVAGYRAGETGAFIHGGAERGPIGALQGFLLPWGKHREQVLAVLEFYVPRQ